jgi:hypothetical protein
MKERSPNINYNSSQTYKVYLKSKTKYIHIGALKEWEKKMGQKSQKQS